MTVTLTFDLSTLNLLPQSLMSYVVSTEFDVLGYSFPISSE